MRIRFRIMFCVFACMWTMAGAGASTRAQEADTPDQGDAVRTFTERTERYLRMRTRLEEPLPLFEVRRDPWSLLLMRRYLASAIRAASPNAREGDILDAPVAKMFRQVIADAIYDIDIEGLVDGDGASADYVVDVVVNEPVPAWALDTVPRALAARLPDLPEAVEYRMVGGSLILWDMHAEIVIDVLPDAFVIQ